MKTAKKPRSSIKSHSHKKKTFTRPALAISRPLSSEVKGFDVPATSYGAYTITAPPTISCLNSIPLGADQYQRVGRKVTNKSLHVKGSIILSSSDALTFLRLIWFYDTQANAASPVISDLLQNSNSAATTDYLSEVNLNNRDRFKILREMRWYAADTTGIGAVSQATVAPTATESIIDLFIPLGGVETMYNGGTNGDIRDIQTGSLNFVCLSSSVTTAEIVFNSRLRYSDV